ncbi:Ger(x)C family spore germination protein [Halalkalibacterium ligniniphilum]|uniref:Ger(x)C family spore germination protein n=2 Tax=Halalkalibacterium ligniniphilum TaxID=1134413 RepID=UPI00037462B8|nr:Ger(x)C family spore germination protein [Halalkalibacterium ligniniphilum]
MRTKLFLHIALLLLVPLLLTGCWNKRELNEIAIVIAVGIDKVAETNDFQVTFQVMNPTAIASGVTGGEGGSNTPITTYTETDKSIFEAIRKVSKKVPRQLYFSHMQVLVIGEELAEEGINEIFDFFDRSSQIRLTTKVVVARETDAASMLKILTPIDKVPGESMAKKIEITEKSWSETINTEIYDVIKAMVNIGREPIISGAKIIGNPAEGENKSNLEQAVPQGLIEIDGVALFKEGKLKRWVEGNQIRGIVWVQDKMQGTIMAVDCRESTDAIGIEVFRSKTNVTAKVQGGKPSFEIEVRQEGSIGEVRCPIDLTKKESITKIEEDWKEATKKEIEEAVSIAQSEQSDILGFGEVVKRQYPKAWKELKNEWDKNFAESQVDVKVDAFIRRPAMRTKSYLSEIKNEGEQKGG